MSRVTLSQSKASGIPLDRKFLRDPFVKETLNREDSRPAVTREKAIRRSSADSEFGLSDLVASLFRKRVRSQVDPFQERKAHIRIGTSIPG